MWACPWLGAPSLAQAQDTKAAMMPVRVVNDVDGEFHKEMNNFFGEPYDLQLSLFEGMVPVW